MNAIWAFGLHPLFVTPNKEMRLLRQYTKSAILVHRLGKYASIQSYSWERLQQEADKINQEKQS